MVIPLAFSSGALSISSKATALALPSSAKTWKGNSTLLQHCTENKNPSFSEGHREPNLVDNACRHTNKNNNMHTDAAHWHAQIEEENVLYITMIIM